MGLEFKAAIQAPLTIYQIREYVIGKFTSQEWRIIRDEGICFSVAFKTRQALPWQEDFMVCIRDSSIYVLDHTASHKTSQTILTAITDSLQSTCPDLIWEEA